MPERSRKPVLGRLPLGLLLGCAVLLTALPVLGAESLPPSVRACSTITDSEERLACYDREVASFPAPAAKATVKSAPVDRPSGTYLQLAATSQREADIEVDVLRRKGFRAMAAEIPEKPGMFRVLVGPVADGNVNKMKTDLQQAGFPGDKAIRRTL